MKKEIIEGMTPPPKQPRKNGTTPDTASALEKRKPKPTTSEEIKGPTTSEMEYVDGVNIYDDSEQEPTEDKKENEEGIKQKIQKDVTTSTLDKQSYDHEFPDCPGRTMGKGT